MRLIGVGAMDLEMKWAEERWRGRAAVSFVGYERRTVCELMASQRVALTFISLAETP